MWEVEYYETEAGIIPVMEFIDGLSSKMQRRAFKELLLLQELGNNIREPYSKPLGNGIFELRIQAEGNAARIFYFFFVGKKIILTNGFLKKTEKTPPSELEKAATYKADYERRKGK